jgi:nucleotide-binding universal stress UspA family protein
VKRILVPLDGTKNAEAALQALAQFCDPDDEVVLVKVEKPGAPQRGGFRPSAPVVEAITGPNAGVASLAAPDVPFYVETGDQVIQRQVGETKDYLERLAHDLRTEGHAVKTEVLIADKPGEAIVQYARETRPAFIAMLRRTHPSVAELIFGSVASSVMKADVSPVLFVPPPDGGQSELIQDSGFYPGDLPAGRSVHNAGPPGK